MLKKSHIFIFLGGALIIFVMMAMMPLLYLHDISDSILHAVDYSVDRVIENGLWDKTMDYDDPVLNETRTIIITEGINEKTSKEVISKLLYLNKLNPEAPIDLIVKTVGGWQDDAFLIADVMKIIEAPVNTWSFGGSHSAGAIILAAGTGTRKASTHSLIMIHALDEAGNEDYSYELKSRTRMEEFWRGHAELPEEFYPMDEDTTYYLTPEEALEYKLIDEIVNR